MDILRLILFSGLVFHKLVWEVLKVKAPVASQPASMGWGKRIVKYAKIGVLLFLIVQTLFLDVFPLANDPTVLRIVGVSIFFLGLAVAVIGRGQLGKNWANVEDRQVLSGQHLVQHGIYKYIRHPIYTGDILLLLGLELALNSWLVLGVIAVVIVVYRQAIQEETILTRAFENYAEYRRQTKRFIPFVI